MPEPLIIPARTITVVCPHCEGEGCALDSSEDGPDPCPRCDRAGMVDVTLPEITVAAVEFDAPGFGADPWRYRVAPGPGMFGGKLTVCIDPLENGPCSVGFSGFRYFELGTSAQMRSLSWALQEAADVWDAVKAARA